MTGWGANDQEFSPDGIKDYYTASYIGLTHRFGDRLDIEAIVQDLRTWRVVPPNSGIAQALRPGGTINFRASRDWSMQASMSYSSNRGFHVYDAVQDGFSISYGRALRRKFNDENGQVSLEYPIHFSAGFQQESFFNFTAGHNQQFKPYIGITIF